MIIGRDDVSKLGLRKPNKPSSEAPAKPDPLALAVGSLSGLASEILAELRRPKPETITDPRPRRWVMHVTRNGKGEIESIDAQAAG